MPPQPPPVGRWVAYGVAAIVVVLIANAVAVRILQPSIEERYDDVIVMLAKRLDERCFGAP